MLISAKIHSKLSLFFQNKGCALLESERANIMLEPKIAERIAGIVANNQKTGV